MVSPQLLDYIRQQFAADIPKEEISKSLIASGWQVSDVNEAFSSLASIPSPSVPIFVQSPVQPASPSGHEGRWVIVTTILLIVGAGVASAAYHYGLFTLPTATLTTPAIAPSTSPLASGMTRYNSGLFGITIDYDATTLFVHSFPERGDGLYSIERLNGPLNFGSYVAGSPDAYKASEYYLTWNYYQYHGDLQEIITRGCTTDRNKKTELQTIPLSDGTSVRGCHVVVTGGTPSKPEINYAQVVYFAEHPITKKLIEFNAVEDFIGGGQDADVQKLYKVGDDLVRSISFYTPDQTGLDLLKKMEDTVNAFKVNPNKDATTTVSKGIGSYKDNSLGIEVHFPSPTWYYKPSVLVSTEYKDQTPDFMKGNNDGADMLLSWRPLFANDTDLKKYQNCTTDNTPGELHMLTAGNTKVYECISASEKSAGGAWSVSFVLQNPITKYHVVFWGNVYGSSMSLRKEMLTKLENIVTATTFFQLSGDALKQMQIMHDSIIGP